MAERRTETQRVAADLRARIISGEWQIEAPIPSTARLIDHYGVSKTVIRDAVGELKAHNILAGQPGKAVYVVAMPQSEDVSSIGVEDLSAQVQRLQEQVDELRANSQPTADPDVRAEIDYVRRLVGVLQTHLIDLYGRVGQPYPYESLPSEPELRRTS